jgi:hypothetical protein
VAAVKFVFRLILVHGTMRASTGLILGDVCGIFGEIGPGAADSNCRREASAICASQSHLVVLTASKSMIMIQ